LASLLALPFASSKAVIEYHSIDPSMIQTVCSMNRGIQPLFVAVWPTPITWLSRVHPVQPFHLSQHLSCRSSYPSRSRSRSGSESHSRLQESRCSRPQELTWRRESRRYRPMSSAAVTVIEALSTTDSLHSIDPTIRVQTNPISSIMLPPIQRLHCSRSGSHSSRLPVPVPVPPRRKRPLTSTGQPQQQVWRRLWCHRSSRPQVQSHARDRTQLQTTTSLSLLQSVAGSSMSLASVLLASQRLHPSPQRPASPLVSPLASLLALPFASPKAVIEYHSIDPSMIQTVCSMNRGIQPLFVAVWPTPITWLSRVHPVQPFHLSQHL